MRLCVTASYIKGHYGITDYQLHKMGGVRKYCREHNLQFWMYNRTDPDDVKRDFYNVYKEYGHIDTVFYLEHGKYSKQAIKTAFGGVNNLMKELDIPLNMSRMDSKEEVSVDIRVLYEQNPEEFCAMYYRKYGKYSESVITRIFGSWANAMDELNLPCYKRYYGKEQMATDIKALYDKYGYLSTKLVDDNCEYSYQAVEWQFGGKDGICELVGDPQAIADTNPSSGEIALSAILTKMYGYGNVQTEVTFDWAVNPDTGYHMRYDFYIVCKNLLIEYDGEQHYRRIEWFYKTEDEFQRAVKRDKVKDRLAQDNGFKLIRITYKDKLTDENVANILHQYA